MNYRVFDRTNVFVRNNTANGVEIFATTLQNVKNSATANLKAVVITDEQYAKQVDSRYVYDQNANIAHTIVFSDVQIEKEVNQKAAEIVSISNRYEQIEVKYADGTREIFDINKSSKAYDALLGAPGITRVMVGDIVGLSTAKGNDKALENITSLIPVTEQGTKVQSYNPRTKLLKLVGDNSNYYLTEETESFITGSLEAGKEIFVLATSVPNNTTEKFVTVLAERTAKDPVKGKGTLVDVTEAENGKVILTVNNGTTIEKLYQFVGSNLAQVKSYKGSTIDFDLQTLNGVECKFNTSSNRKSLQ